MDKASFGALFKFVRMEKGVSQSELSYGVCTPRTIYNIERGSNIPSIELMLHFANKLGFDFLSILSYSNSEKGLLYYKMFRDLEKSYENNDFADLEKQTDQLLDDNSDLSPYQYQILYWYKGICKMALRRNYEEAKADLSLALSYTREFGLEEIVRHYCTIQELHIINSYAGIYFLEGDYRLASDLFKDILDNLNRYGKNSNDPLYVKISYNLAKALNKLKQPGEALRVCNEAIALAQKNNILNSLAELYIEKGNSHDMLGEFEERNRSFKRFIYLHEICGNDDIVQSMKERFRVKYDIGFDVV